MEDRKSALVIGGTGFIGRRLVKNLLKEGVEVTIATRGKSPNPFGDKVRPLVLDRFSLENISESFSREMHFDILFDQVGFGPDDMETTLSGLDGIVGRYVYTSSMAVYDKFADRTSESDFDPLSYAVKEGGIGNLGYSEGKRSAEAYLFKHSRVPAVAARFPIVIGPDDVTGRVQFHVDRILESREIVVPRPCGRMNYIWVEDAGRFLAWLGLKGKEGTYNAASRESADARGMIVSMASALNREPVIVEQGKKEDISPYHVDQDRMVSVEKAEKEGFAFTSMETWLPEVAKQTAESKGVQHNKMDYLQGKLQKKG